MPAASAAPSEFANRGWLILAFASVTAALTGPGQTIGVAVFIDSFVDDLGLTRSQVSTAYLVGTLIGAAALPWMGRVIDRRGVRVAQVAIGLGFAVAIANMSLVTGLIWLTIGFAGIRFLGQGSLSLAATVTVALAFARSRGFAIGIFATATSGLMALVPVALNATIDGVGWRRAWLLTAAVIAVTVVPIGWFGLRSLPAGRRTTTSDAPADGTAIVTTSDTSFDRTEALRTRSFWMLATVSASASMLGTALNFHQIDLMGDAGISKASAAALFIPQVLGSTLAGLVIGYLSDRLGRRYLPAAGMALLVAALLLGAVIAPGPVAIVYAIVLGAMGGGVRTATATLLPAWFGTAHLGSIQGLLTFFVVASSATGPVTLALLESAFGSYPRALLLLAVIPLAAFVNALRDDPARRPLILSRT